MRTSLGGVLVTALLALPGCGDASQGADVGATMTPGDRASAAADRGQVRVELATGLTLSEVDSAGVALMSIDGPVEALPEWSLTGAPVVTISGDLPPYLGSVGQVALLSTGRVLVEDNQTAELHLFDSEGSYVGLVGRRGDGPGEYRDIATLTPVGGDTVWVYDRRHRRLSALEADGTLVRELTLREELAGPRTLLQSTWPIGNRRFVVESSSAVDARPTDQPTKLQQDVLVMAINDSASVVGAPIRLPGRVSMFTQFGIVSGFFTTEPVVSVAAHTVLWGSGRTYELVLATESLEPTRIIRWSGWAAPVTDSLVLAARDTFEQSLAEMRESRPDRVATIMDAVFAPEVVGDTLPALRSAFLDNSGRIWVSRFRLMDDRWHQEHAWHVLEADGSPLARVTLPPSSRVATVRDTEVALVVRDGLDVEHVLIHAVHSAGEAR